MYTGLARCATAADALTTVTDSEVWEIDFYFFLGRVKHVQSYLLPLKFLWGYPLPHFLPHYLQKQNCCSDLNHVAVVDADHTTVQNIMIQVAERQVWA